MVTIQIEGRGEFKATDVAVEKFNLLTKKELAAKIAQGYEGQAGSGVAYWRTLPKETLVVVAGDMFQSETPVHVAPGEPVTDKDIAEFEEGVNQGMREAGEIIRNAKSEPPVTPVPLKVQGPFVLKATHRDGFLRRDQPRKPGDSATYKLVEDLKKASVFKSWHQAQAKLSEAASLLDVPAQIARLTPSGAVEVL